MEQFYRDYGGQADMYLVYIREAHPDVAAEVARRADPDDGDAPETMTGRATVAAVGVHEMGLNIPVLIDDMDDLACKAYAAWPSRVVIIDRAGRIAYHSQRGPDGLSVDAAQRRLQAVLDRR